MRVYIVQVKSYEMKKVVMSSILFVLCLTKFASSKGIIPSFAGPFRIILRRVSNVSDDYTSMGDFWMQIRIRTSMSSSAVPYGWGMSHNKIPIDDNIRILIMIHSWKNNQWKKNEFRMNFKHACSDALTYAPSLLPLIYGEDGYKCPVAPGDRIIPNKSLELHFPNVPVFPYGRWLLVLVGFLKERVAGIHTLEADTIPKI